MKKVKSLCLLASILILGIVTMPFLSAAGNRVEIVTRAKQYVFRNTQGGSVGVLKQEIVEEDLVKGNLTVELTLDNSRNTEIYYIFNGTNATTTISNFKTLTENIFTALGTTKTKIGSILVSNTAIANPMYSTVSEVGNGLDDLGEETVTTGATLNQAVVAAKQNFTNTSDNKILVIVDNTQTVSQIKSAITENTDGITIITVTTATATVEGVISTTDTSGVNNAIAATLIPVKNNMTIALPFASYITDNFNISLVNNPSDATLDTTTKTINWNLGNVASNAVKTLKYKLELKTAVDDSILGQNLILNEAPTIIFNGITVANTAANECSPVIKILNEAVDNPKTGISNYIIFSSFLLAIGGITYVVSKKKSLETI